MSYHPNQGVPLPDHPYDNLGFHPTLALYGGEHRYLESEGFDPEDAREIIDFVDGLTIPLNDKHYDDFIQYCVSRRLNYNLPIIDCIASGFEFHFATSGFPRYNNESRAVSANAPNMSPRIVPGKRSAYKASFRPIGDNYEYVELAGFQTLPDNERVPVTAVMLKHTTRGEERYMTLYHQAGDLPGIGLRYCDRFSWDDFVANSYRVATAEGSMQEAEAAWSSCRS